MNVLNIKNRTRFIMELRHSYEVYTTIFLLSEQKLCFENTCNQCVQIVAVLYLSIVTQSERLIDISTDIELYIIKFITCYY